MSVWSISICGFDYRLKMARNKALPSETRQSVLVLRNEGYSMREIAKKLKISHDAVRSTDFKTIKIFFNTDLLEDQKKPIPINHPICLQLKSEVYIHLCQIHFFSNFSVYSCSEILRLFHARNCQETEDLVHRCVLLPSQNSANWL